MVAGIRQAEWMRELARQVKCLLAEAQSLIRKPEVPQGQEQIATVGYCGVLPGEAGPTAALLRIVAERDRLSGMLAGLGEIAAVAQGRCRKVMGLTLDPAVI